MKIGRMLGRSKLELKVWRWGWRWVRWGWRLVMWWVEVGKEGVVRF